MSARFLNAINTDFGIQINDLFATFATFHKKLPRVTRYYCTTLERKHMGERGDDVTWLDTVLSPGQTARYSR